MRNIKLTKHQAFMLKMFADGWGFRLHNERRGSWLTFWSLRRKGLISSGKTVEMAGKPVAVDRLTLSGRQALTQYLGAKHD